MKIFFTLLSICCCVFFSRAQQTQKEVVEQFINSILQTEEGDYPGLWKMLKITQTIPEEEGGMEKINQVFALLKNQIQKREYIIVSSEEALQIMETENDKRSSDILFSDKGTVFYVYLTYFKRFLIRSPIVVNDKNEIIAIFIDYCKDNKICIKYL